MSNTIAFGIMLKHCIEIEWSMMTTVCSKSSNKRHVYLVVIVYINGPYRRRIACNAVLCIGPVVKMNYEEYLITQTIHISRRRTL